MRRRRYEQDRIDAEQKNKGLQCKRFHDKARASFYDAKRANNMSINNNRVGERV